LESSPLLTELWRHVRATGDHIPAGQRIACGRHILESQLGLDTLEVPLSRLCDTPWFFEFAMHLMQHHQRLREVYNAAVKEYRTVHRIRSRNHPVPDLSSSELGCEIPFWLWSSKRPRRHAAFVRAADGGCLQLSGVARDERSTGDVLSMKLDPRSGDLFGQYEQQLRQNGLKLRPRALVTTLYARLVLGDYFLHGIGGAKYDELTDALIARFFGLVPPRFATVTGTYLLPCARTDSTETDRRDVLRQLRQIRFHPELCLTAAQVADPVVRQLVEEKRGWTRRQAANGIDRRQRHRSIRRINEQLSRFVDQSRSQWEQQLVQLNRGAREAAILNSREYPFCLFREEHLLPLLRGAADADS
jgi:hypothetical protein